MTSTNPIVRNALSMARNGMFENLEFQTAFGIKDAAKRGAEAFMQAKLGKAPDAKAKAAVKSICESFIKKLGAIRV